MSTLENDVLAENLFERLEALEAFLDLNGYIKYQQELLRHLARSEFEEARDKVTRLEQLYKLVEAPHAGIY